MEIAQTSQTAILGAAGEYYVMSELLRRGYIAALSPRGVPNADIVVSDIHGKRLCSIQVKTRRNAGSDGGWHMKQKHEELQSDTLYYCFVDFGSSAIDRPNVYILPSKIVAEALAKSHAHWLRTPGKGGKQHQDTPMRRFLPDYSKLYGNNQISYGAGWLDVYQDGWHLLNLETYSSNE